MVLEHIPQAFGLPRPHEWKGETVYGHYVMDLCRPMSFSIRAGLIAVETSSRRVGVLLKEGCVYMEEEDDLDMGLLG